MMTALHMKGYVLQLLHRQGVLWDHEVVDAVMREYGYSGEYWNGTIRVTLTDLYSSGLLQQLDTTIDPEKPGGDRVQFKYGLTDFGRERMRQSGLLKEVTR